VNVDGKAAAAADPAAAKERKVYIFSYLNINSRTERRDFVESQKWPTVKLCTRAFHF
jgi:hypothetical protein